MAPPFIPEDEQLPLIIRNAIKTHCKGTWGNTTKLYNTLVPSRVPRTQDSLQNRYKIMDVEQVQQRIQGIDNSVLGNAVQQTFRKMLNVSVYAVKYSELIVQKRSGTRARTQTVGAQSQNYRRARNTSIRSTELSIASQRVSRHSMRRPSRFRGRRFRSFGLRDSSATRSARSRVEKTVFANERGEVVIKCC
jgi:hypothetical protein